MTEEGVEGKLKELLQNRGKKGTDRKGQIAELEQLAEVVVLELLIQELLH